MKLPNCNLLLLPGAELHEVLQQERRVGVRGVVLGGLHLRGDALRQGQEPRGRGEGPERTDSTTASKLSQFGL